MLVSTLIRNKYPQRDKKFQMTHAHIKNFWKCLLVWGRGKGLNLSVTWRVLSYLQDKHPSRILRKFNAKKIVIILENLDLKKSNLRGGRAIQVQQRTNLTVFKMFGWEAKHKICNHQPLVHVYDPFYPHLRGLKFKDEKHIHESELLWIVNK